MKTGKNHLIRVLILLAGLIIIAGVSLIFFPTTLSFLMEKNKLFHSMLKIRLPEIMIAITAGACLGLAGALMQIVLGNPLASPFTLGISAASAFGAALAICLEFYYGILWLNPGIFAFLFSIVSIVLLLMIITFSGVSQRNIILVGLAVNFFFNAANTFLQYSATPDAIYQDYILENRFINNSRFETFSYSVFSTVCFFTHIAVFSKDLGIIQQGERNAVMHGVNVNFERVLFLILCSLLASISVSIVGIIGFTGLVAPHISRLLKLEAPHNLIISSTLIGTLLLVSADIISKIVLHPAILPISAVTSLFGIPLLLFLLTINGRSKR